jgi:hypothetical protein
MEKNSKQSEEEKKKIISMCICEGCPSYVDCGEDVGYCASAVGKSKCIEEEKGCICEGCPVYSEMNLKNLYYCIKGSEDEQGGK